MDICHQGNRDFFLDLADGCCRFFGRNSTANDVTACRCQFPDLGDGGRHILGLCIGHGLDQDGIAPADHTVSDMDHFCMVTIHLIHPF